MHRIHTFHAILFQGPVHQSAFPKATFTLCEWSVPTLFGHKANFSAQRGDSRVACLLGHFWVVIMIEQREIAC